MSTLPVRSINRPGTLWFLLALPGLLLLWSWHEGAMEAADLLHPSGETSARLMILAMAIGPLMALFGARGWTRWLMRRRRWFGVAAFGYALLHLFFYVIDMGNVPDMLAEALAPGIWTGWAAIALMLPLALTSNDAAMRALRAGWKRLQRLVYPAAILTLLHWIWVHNGLVGALAHFLPLALLIGARILKPRLSPSPATPGV